MTMWCSRLSGVGLSRRNENTSFQWEHCVVMCWEEKGLRVSHCGCNTRDYFSWSVWRVMVSLCLFCPGLSLQRLHYARGCCWWPAGIRFVLVVFAVQIQPTFCGRTILHMTTLGQCFVFCFFIKILQACVCLSFRNKPLGKKINLNF